VSETWPHETSKSDLSQCDPHCDEDYFDTYDEFPVETGDYYFDAEEEIEFEASANLCEDLLDLHSIYNTRTVVDCAGTEDTCDPTGQDQAEVNLAPSQSALRVLLDGAVLSTVALATADLLCAVIFDTGASLAISPYRSDFVADPTPLAKPTQLGGMGKGLQIEGIGTVTWTFTAKDQTEIQIRTRAYYVPAAKARLLSPQKLFDKKRGVFGRFYGDEEKFTLQIGDCPEIEVSYCAASGLPIGSAVCGVTAEPTVNVSLLDDENTKLSRTKTNPRVAL
jgi:hypothetical protein